MIVVILYVFSHSKGHVCLNDHHTKLKVKQTFSTVNLAWCESCQSNPGADQTTGPRLPKMLDSMMHEDESFNLQSHVTVDDVNLFKLEPLVDAAVFGQCVGVPELC